MNEQNIHETVLYINADKLTSEFCAYKALNVWLQNIFEPYPFTIPE